MGTIDLFREFHNDAIQREFTPSARVLFDVLLFQFDAINWTVDSLAFSERDLVQMTGLKKTALHDAKHFLSSRHIIQCHNSKKGSFFKIVQKPKQLQPTTNRPPDDHHYHYSTPGSSTKGCSFVVTTHEYEKQTNNSDDVMSMDVSYGIRPTENSENSKSDEKSDELDELMEYWKNELHGGRLTFEHISRLEVLVDEKGIDWVRDKMREASDANKDPWGISPKFLFGVIEFRQNLEKSEKGKKERENPEFDVRATWQADDDE